MHRKHFLKSTLALSAGGLLHFKSNEKSRVKDHTSVYSRPPYLLQGDIVAITCPAGFISFEEIQPAVQMMESWGFKIKIGKTIGKKDCTFGGTDAERTQDLQEQLDDPEIKAIMCARGGYGSIRIIDNISWVGFMRHPKWIIGFSDITVLHNHVHANYKIATVHSKMCNSFPDASEKTEPVQMEAINSIREALQGDTTEYAAAIDTDNRKGQGRGILVGGNLKTIESLAGSRSDIKTDNKILFVEDTGEYLYSIDRMFWNLKRTGKLSRLQGLIVGGFTVKPDDPGEDFGKTVQQIVLEKVKEYAYPVCFGFPVGHQKANFALKCGINHSLVVNENQVTLTELV